MVVHEVACDGSDGRHICKDTLADPEYLDSGRFGSFAVYKTFVHCIATAGSSVHVSLHHYFPKFLGSSSVCFKYSTICATASFTPVSSLVILISAFSGASYGALTPVKPVISPALAFLYSPFGSLDSATDSGTWT